MLGSSGDQAAQILVVDDVAANLLAIEAALEAPTYELVLANSGAEALRHLLERDFALILLDVQMPSMDGFETARMIRQRKRSRHVPIIFITAYDRNDRQILDAYRLGAVDFLFKPVNPEILRAKATVFVELQRRTAEIRRQAALLKAHERAERERALADQRRRLEAEALRRSLADQRAHAEALARANAELEQIRAALEHSNQRLALADQRKDEFIAVLAHELRNPLAAIMSGLDVLETNPSAAMVHAVRPIMHRQGRHLIRLVDDLLDIARVVSGKMKLHKRPVRVAELLTDAIELARPELEARKHTLEADCDCADSRIFGDPVRLAQILANLLCNAARYTDRGGRVWLRARLDAAASAGGESGRVRISVRDNGRGMTPELAARVFDMFVQGQSGGGGLGIGLTLVRRLAQLHDGEVTARSEGPGLGSEFELCLPVAEIQAQPHSTEPRERQIDPAPHMRVALIDDDRDVRELTRSMLECWGHSVFEAGGGSDGIALVLGERPDVAIIDIALHDIEGYEVARRLRAQLGERCPRLIAMTGLGLPTVRERVFAAGFNAYLAKPAKSEALRSAMHATER